MWRTDYRGGENGRLGAGGVDAYCCGGRGSTRMLMRMDRRERLENENDSGA